MPAVKDRSREKQWCTRHRGTADNVHLITNHPVFGTERHVCRECLKEMLDGSTPIYLANPWRHDGDWIALYSPSDIPPFC